MFPEIMPIRFLLHFENEKASKRMGSPLPEKLSPPELKEEQGNPFWKKGMRNNKGQRIDGELKTK